MNNSLIYPKSGGGGYCFRGSIAYTEDDIPVQRLHFCKVPPEMSVDALKAYFLTFGNVLEFQLGKDPRKKFEPCLSGDVLFANAKVAANALECRAPYVDGMEIEVKSSYSWLQPDAYGPPAEDQQQDVGPISILTDYCWVNILQFLGMRDKIRFARSCKRFRAIYHMATAGQYKSVDRNEFFKMTLWDIRDFYQMSGGQVLKVTCFSSLRDPRYLDEIIDLTTVYCRNLISLSLEQEVVTKYTMLKMPTSIEILKLFCEEVKDLPIICKHFCNLRELDVREIKVSGPAWSYIVKNNCCPSLEVLSISLDSKCDIVAQLPKLKSLMIRINNTQAGGDMIDQLVKHKAEQLERFETEGGDSLSISQLSEIAKLTGLRKLILYSQYEMTGDVLKKFVRLKKLEEITFLAIKVSNAAILDLFIGCPKLSHVNVCFTSSSVSKLVLKIVAQVRREIASKEIHRKLPIELVLDMFQTKVDEIILNNPETVTKDIIKIIGVYGKYPTESDKTSGDEFKED